MSEDTAATPQPATREDAFHELMAGLAKAVIMTEHSDLVMLEVNQAHERIAEAIEAYVDARLKDAKASARA